MCEWLALTQITKLCYLGKSQALFFVEFRAYLAWKICKPEQCVISVLDGNAQAVDGGVAFFFAFLYLFKS